MLSGDFFYITSLDQHNGKVSAALELNATHKIFGGHFPGQPVVPGVCMMQLVKEILEVAVAGATRLISSDSLKFLTVIDPTENSIVHAELTYSIAVDGKIKVAASLVNGPVTYFKMSGIFIFAAINY